MKWHTLVVGLHGRRLHSTLALPALLMLCAFSATTCSRITTTDGLAWNVFDRTLLATNDALYEQVRPISLAATHTVPDDWFSLCTC